MCVVVIVLFEVVDDVFERVRSFVRVFLFFGVECLIMYVKVIKLWRVVYEYVYFFCIDVVNVFDDGVIFV